MGAPMATATQYHTQDELGQASFGYAHPGQASVNQRDANGNQFGSYAYINPEGKEVRVSYVADALGFRVISNDLPVGPVANLMPVMETPEVSAARAAHLAAHRAARVVAVPIGPMPIQETPEVLAARAEFMRSFNEAKLRSL